LYYKSEISCFLSKILLIYAYSAKLNFQRDLCELCALAPLRETKQSDASFSQRR
jgi:hypothetical protein